MTKERWKQIEHLFLEAVELDPPVRARFLEEHCTGDDQLRRSVEEMLASDSDGQDLDQAVSRASRMSDGAWNQGLRVGSYEIVREIGRGGMGTVYQAVRKDGGFEQAVAIKLMRGGLDTGDFARRFRNERRILARLDHPNIARLLDGGTSIDGDPYIVMELVDGESISTYCEKNHVTLEQRLRLFLSICDAVRYAHQSLVVHRDLKPSNILVTNDGVVKLLDFGISKLLDPDSEDGANPRTKTELRMLTPDYTSPEHIRGEDVTTLADVYSLGAVLYELVSGERAHRFAGTLLSEIERAVCEVQPERPSIACEQNTATQAHQWHRKLRGDLDNIVLTALRKEPARRYRSVEQFADDIRRHIADLPVFAQKETLVYRAEKFIKRNKTQVVLASLLVISLIAGTAISVVQARRAEHRFEQLRKLANVFAVDVDSQIQDLPGVMPARKTMVHNLQNYYDGLAKESRQDPRLDYEMAVAYLRLGDALGLGVRANLGEFEAAEASYRKGLKMAERAFAHDTSDAVQRELARAHHRLGFALRGIRKNYTEAFAEASKGLEIIEPVFQRDQANSESMHVYAELLGLKGDLFSTMGKKEEFAAAYEKGFQTVSQFALLHPSPDAYHTLANWHFRMITLTYPRNPEEGLKHGMEGEEILQKLVKENPANARMRRDLWNLMARTGALLSMHKDPKQAAAGVEMVRKSITISEELAKGDPINVRAQGELVLSYQHFCEVIARVSATEALQYCAKAEKEISLHPQFAYRLPEIYRDKSLLLQEIGNKPEALDMMRKSIAELQKDGKNNSKAVREAYLDLARMQKEFGDATSARQSESEAARFTQ